MLTSNNSNLENIKFLFLLIYMKDIPNMRLSFSNYDLSNLKNFQIYDFQL